MKTLPSIPDSVLRAESVRIDPREITDALVASMFRTMRECGGVGLAAPQIGMLYRLAVVEHASQRFVLVNPVWQSVGKRNIEYGVEGCLSLPGRRFQIGRPRRIRVTYDVAGEKVTISAEGTLARIFQHELEHLDGRLVDRGREVTAEAA